MHLIQIAPKTDISPFPQYKFKPPLLKFVQRPRLETRLNLRGLASGNKKNGTSGLDALNLFIEEAACFKIDT